MSTFTNRFLRFIDIERCIHSLKTAFACLIGYLLTKMVELPVDQWLLITIIVVMTAQIHVGSVIQKSYSRFLGTVVGALIAALALTYYGKDVVPIAGVIALTAMVFSYIATGSGNFREAGTLGAATTVIILVGVHPTLWTALERFLEISAGILICALVSQFILPIHARTHLRRSQGETLFLLQQYYNAALLSSDKTMHTSFYHKLEQPIVKSLTMQRTLAEESTREPLGEKFSVEHFTEFLQCEIEILRSIDFMHYALDRSPTTMAALNSQPLLKDFHDMVKKSLEKLGEIVNHPEKRVPSIQLPNISALKETMRHQNVPFTADEVAIIDTFIFCAEVLIEQLKKLAILYQIEPL